MEHETIHIMTNPMMIGLVKTAFVGINPSSKQLGELYLTCPNSEITAYECSYAFVVQDKSALQEFIELNYADKEIAPDSELYYLNADELIKELKAFELEDITQDIQEKLDSLLTDKQKQEIESVKEKMAALN